MRKSRWGAEALLVVLLVVALLTVRDMYLSGCRSAVGRVEVRYDTVRRTDTVYIPIPKYNSRVRVVTRSDTVFISDTTARRDTITVVYPLYSDSALLEVRYAPERMILDTIMITRDSIVYQDAPWYEKVAYFSAGVLTGILFILVAR
jgi:hypothetical protein